MDAGFCNDKCAIGYTAEDPKNHNTATECAEKPEPTQTNTQNEFDKTVL